MSARSTTIKDPSDGAVASVDRISEHVGFIDVVHHRIHEGRMYTAFNSATTIPDDSEIGMLLRPPGGTFAHVRFRALVGGDAELELFEGTTTTFDGVAQTPVNRNRVTLGGGPDAAVTAVFNDPIPLSLGTELFDWILPGGSGFFTAGSQSNDFFELVLDPGQTYFARLTNRSGGATFLTLVADFYE